MKLPKFLTKRRNLIYGGIILIGGFLIYLLISRGQGNGSAGGVQYVETGPSEQLQMAQLQAQTQIALSNNQSQAALAQTQTQANAALAMAEFQGELEAALAMRSFETQIGLATIDREVRGDELEAQLAGLTAQLEQQAFISQTQAYTQQQEIEANREIQSAQIEATQSMFNRSIEAQVAQSAMQSNALMHQANINADMFMSQLEAGVIEEQYRRDIELAELDVQRELGIEELRNERYATKKQAGASKRKDTLGFVGGLVGGALSFFSDVRLKSDIERVGETPGGIPTYRYKIGGRTEYGVMAQEVQNFLPEAVHDANGYLMVDYGMVA